MKKLTKAQIIFNKVKGDRKAFIAAVKTELDMTDAGANTYFMVCRRKASPKASEVKPSNPALLFIATL